MVQQIGQPRSARQSALGSAGMAASQALPAHFAIYVGGCHRPDLPLLFRAADSGSRAGRLLPP